MHCATCLGYIGEQTDKGPHPLKEGNRQEQKQDREVKYAIRNIST